MTPVSQPEHRPAYRDPRLRLEVTHLTTAAHLVLCGHPLLHVLIRRGETRYVFEREAKADYERLLRITDEVAAYRERTAQGHHTLSLVHQDVIHAPAAQEDNHVPRQRHQ